MTGRYRPGEKLPGEPGLVREFGTSRITIGRAIKELQQRGLVSRRAGSGTYVRSDRSTTTFGLLIPDLGETEIFEPVCQGISASMRLPGHALLWGHTAGRQDRGEQAWQLCRHFIERRVAGVFFAPLEYLADQEEINLRIATALSEAKIPVILLDRDIVAYPERSSYDLVSLDNRGAGREAANHLVLQGRRRIAFVYRPGSAPSVAARMAGCREALLAHSLACDPILEAALDPSARKPVLDFLGATKPDAVICANDRTAAELMQTLIEAGVRIPADLALVGVDDVPYAGLLPVPLTTLQQPSRAIGQVALSTMMERLAEPRLPAREVLLQGKLVIRQSCGSA